MKLVSYIFESYFGSVIVPLVYWKWGQQTGHMQNIAILLFCKYLDQGKCDGEVYFRYVICN